jgi:hypothetical protein
MSQQLASASMVVLLLAACGDVTELEPDGSTDTDQDAGDDAGADTDTDTGTDTGECPEPDCAEPCVRYVKTDGDDSSCGLNWYLPFGTIQAGVDAAHEAAAECDITCQVWVAAGTYTIYQGEAEDTLQLRPGVELYGGFEAFEDSLDERDWVANETIIHGGWDEEQNEPEGCEITVTGSDDAVLDGFTVTGGFGWMGSGMSNVDVSPVVANCTFHGNSGVVAGAIDNIGGAPTIRDCVFFDNVADAGTAIRNHEAATSITGCVFLGGTGFEEHSGVIDNFDAGATISNCIFTGSSYAAIVVAGGITVTNSVFYGNTIDPAVYVKNLGYASISNSIFWNNEEDIQGSFEASYTDFADEVPGEGNLTADPMFADPSSGDFTLQPGSPLIDAADGSLAPELDIDGNPRWDDPEATNTGIGPPWADIGAYERQPD